MAQNHLKAIAPHALAYDGYRWHARAFDFETEDYRDFVLGRMAKPKPAAAVAPQKADDDWERFVTLAIGPHPGLTPAQARAISLDYNITKGSARIRVRRALLYYALKRLGLDVPADTRPPNAQQIVLLNRDEIARQIEQAPQS